jgi:hypothetical protein
VISRIEAGVEDLRQGQQHTLQVALQIQESVAQGWELTLREFTRRFNGVMKYLEAECPNIFCLMPVSRGFNPLGWTSRPYQLYLLCQHPPEPHIVGEGYRIQQPKEWWIILHPWLDRLITLLKVGVPIVGAAAGVINEAAARSREVDTKLLESLAAELPKLPQQLSPPLDRSAEPELARDREVYGPALRALHTFLNKVDDGTWGGLYKVQTPDGNILWLCDEHRQPYKSTTPEL